MFSHIHTQSQRDTNKLGEIIKCTVYHTIMKPYHNINRIIKNRHKIQCTFTMYILFEYNPFSKNEFYQVFLIVQIFNGEYLKAYSYICIRHTEFFFSFILIRLMVAHGFLS